VSFRILAVLGVRGARPCARFVYLGERHGGSGKLNAEGREECHPTRRID
jgi:hypothetical protein